MDITETSFEEIQSSFLNESNDFNRFSGKQGNHLAKKSNTLRPKASQHMLPAPLSTASSGGTAFSEEIKDQSTWLKDDEDIFYDNNKPGLEDIEEDNDFLDDFEEFQNRKDNFDEAIKTNFKPLPLRSSTLNSYDNDFHNRFNRILKINEDNMGRQGDSRGGIRQLKSMMNLKTPRFNSNDENLPSTRGRNGRIGLKNSISYSNLHNPSRNHNSVRFKKSMPNLSPRIMEEDIENSVVRQRISSDYKLNKYEEDADSPDENDFNFDSSMIQAKFLPKLSRANVPLKLSPSIYNIEQHDNLLTPQLHRRTSKNWNAREQLESFREDHDSSKNNNSRKTSGKFNLNHIAPTFRMRTIKQQIDHNTPVKKGQMYYNPQSMKWEGNERLLKKFDDIESKTTNPMLIKKNLKLEKLENMKLRSRSQKSPEVVGDMVFDEKNLRWVSIHEEPADPFAGIDDIVSSQPSVHYPSPFLRSQSSVNPNPNSGSTTGNPNLRKYHSIGAFKKVGMNAFDVDNESIDSTFKVSSRLLEYFYHEENRWNKKVGGWFILSNNNEDDNQKSSNQQSLNDVSVTSHSSKDYMYEIRKMVLNSTRN